MLARSLKVYAPPLLGGLIRRLNYRHSAEAVCQAYLRESASQAGFYKRAVLVSLAIRSAQGTGQNRIIAGEKAAGSRAFRAVAGHTGLSAIYGKRRAVGVPRRLEHAQHPGAGEAYQADRGIVTSKWGQARFSE